MQKILPSLAIMLIGLGLFGFGFIARKETLKVGLIDQQTTCVQTAIASTTRTYLHFGNATYGTTTLSLDTHRSQRIELTLVANVASSTGTNYDVLLETSSNDIEYYPASYSMAQGTDHATTTITLPNTDVVYRWLPGKTATTSRAFIIEPIMGNFTRFIFSVGTSTSVTSRGSIWAQVCAK